MEVSLKAMRVNRDMTQQELANKTGISVSIIKNYESKRTVPRWNHIESLCNVLECSVDDIRWS